MIELKKNYENAKKKANKFMKKGQISAYMTALFEMNHYKKMMLTSVEG